MIKLTNAIEIGELNIKQAGKQMPSETLEAIMLLVECGKRIDRQRHMATGIVQPKLPGEDLV